MVRTNNNPVGDIAEAIVHAYYCGERGGFSQAGWDIKTPDAAVSTSASACRPGAGVWWARSETTASRREQSRARAACSLLLRLPLENGLRGLAGGFPDSHVVQQQCALVPRSAP